MNESKGKHKRNCQSKQKTATGESRRQETETSSANCKRCLSGKFEHGGLVALVLVAQLFSTQSNNTHLSAENDQNYLMTPSCWGKRSNPLETQQLQGINPHY